MAVVALLLGSMLGMAGALLGWAVLGMSVLSAFGLYFAVSLGFATLAVAAAALRPEPAPLMLETLAR